MQISQFARSYVRTRTAERMADACRIFKPGKVVLDKTTGKTKREPAVIKYDGQCRFWEVTAGQQALLGDQQVVFSQSYLSIPYNAPVPESDDIVLITESDDPDLRGRTVRVISTVRGGGLRASRRFLVQVHDSQKDTW